MKAILSVSNKAGLVDFAKGLEKLNVDIYSTGGTKKALSDAGVKVHSVSDLTGFPEILDGRVKTLHPMVHGGILARRDKPDHMKELDSNKIDPIDMVVVNLYPFVQTVAKPDVTLADALENIDIGGPTMIRASAKNHPSVLVVVDPSDYDNVLELLGKGEVPADERKKLAQKAYQHTATYDTAISQYLLGDESLPDDMTIALKKKYDLRYGENSHQKAAFYEEQVVGGAEQTGIISAEQLWGKALSFNNILDADAAWSTATDYPDPTVSVVKHTNSCGLASHPVLVEAYKRAYSGDTVSAFGGICAINRKVDLATAQEIYKNFYEIVIAPAYNDDALEYLKKKKDLRILLAKPSDFKGYDFRRVEGGMLVQDADIYPEDKLEITTATKRQPTEQELKDLIFAFRAVKHIKSNAIVFAKEQTLLGMGAGQPNRVISVELSFKLSGDAAKGAVMASDAFFPFPDCVDLAHNAGITAIIQPGGSMNDKASIEAADKYGMAMVFTGIRHFRH
ncbi:MAG: bifunctional phosphoribosylaminoimidazolecarboxamide formyltransferase/IMP cyclohydrolase [Chloroflexi bacterium]|jgi:phosphoribosylaminoimidazolecarboxamide formyltransferase / IMP cyclohydrolase|nr:bifunctional phosphoribosylaminoimidazolecarboxamide formyltransferase/IMP cyclohydrolase [Chloroflexota bacterium]MBT7082419.1 bifunctional phosphoribosylaminoimidazolecarboxamide formyltransferase/IMP cyclohydrolase [Chloroflexota bacterium]